MGCRRGGNRFGRDKVGKREREGARLKEYLPTLINDYYEFYEGWKDCVYRIIIIF